MSDIAGVVLRHLDEVRKNAEQPLRSTYPPPDDAHAVGAPLRPPSGRPPLRAHRLPGTRRANSCSKRSTESLATPPYHPHIQHANLGITSVYLQGIDSSEIIETVHGRPSPTISASAGLQIRR
jgi:hypothetical protein